MKNLKIKKVSAQNFLAFGPQGVEINFDDLGKIVLVKGKNLDYIRDLKDKSQFKNKDSSNGSGKSSVQEIISYAIYGKTIKNPKKISKDDVINNLFKKGCKVEVILENYKISRGRDPDYLRLWESKDCIWNKETEITQGKQQDTQEKIDSIVGINYETFISTCIFTDDQANCFLESDLASKRSIIENLLSLDIYRFRFDHSKNLLKESKSNLKQLCLEYEMLNNNYSTLQKRLMSAKEDESNWKKSKKNDMTKILLDIKSKKEKLDSLNQDFAQKEYEEAQKKILDINNSIDEVNLKIENLQNELKNKQEFKNKLDSSLIEKKNKIQELNKVLSEKNSLLKQNSNEVININKKNTEKKCKYCLSDIDPKNFVEIIKNYEKQNNKIEEEIISIKDKINKIEIKDLQENLIIVDKEIKKLDNDLNKNNDLYKLLRQNYKDLSSIKEPNTNTEKSVLEKEIEVLKNKAKELRKEYEECSPYEKVLTNIEYDIKDSEKSMTEKKDAIKIIEKDLPYLDFWVEAFGDSGIRKWVVDGIIPILNKKLQYLMFILDNNRMNIEFNNKLEERIFKIVDGKEIDFKYHTLSAGQKRRLNLAVSQSFAHIMMDSVGSCPSLLFLDEVTTNIDPVGVLGIYNLICELADDRQVFVTTHDIDLLEMLNGCDTLNFEMNNGISTLKQKK